MIKLEFYMLLLGVILVALGIFVLHGTLADWAARIGGIVALIGMVFIIISIRKK